MTIEKDSYDICKHLSKYDIKIFIVWLFDNGNKFYGNLVDNLIISEPETQRELTNGSHTPYLIVSKKNLLNMIKFTDEI